MGLRAASLFILWLALSYANEIRKGRTRSHGHYVCSTWGNNHFKTFDGDIYQFPGICEYNFVSDCRESYPEFSVHIQRALNSHNHPEIQYILVKIKDIMVYLKPKLVVVDGRIVKTPYYSSGVLIESNDIYTKIYAKLGMVLMWNQQDALMVELDNKFNNHTCGLCGDYNGIPIYNEFIRGDASYNSITYGNLQKINKPNVRCEDPDETQALPSCNGHRKECERLLTSSAFADCRLRLHLETYIQACMQDKCACNGRDDSFCLCSTISEYSRQCSHAGGRPGEWRTQSFCPKTCPDTMVYRESSSPCMDTCSHLEISSLCEEHYMDGCFCPEGTVYDDITEKGCIPVSQCHCKLHGKQYSPGASISNECEECTCNSGRWTCKDLPCPGRCSVEGGSHITTFDGKKYTFHGDCYYVLAKGTANDSYALLVELVPCGSTDRQTCLKTVVLLVDHKRNVVVFRSDGSVLLNEMRVNVPHVSASFSVFQPSSNYIVVQTSFGIQLQIQLLRIMQLFVTADQSVQGNLQGLCGNFNGMEGDDFKTTSGLVEATGSAFANTWKAQSICTDRVEKLEDPCSLSIESANYAEHWCSLLKNPEGPFARCHLVIDPSEYYKKCKYDTCLCEDNEECLCAALSSYSRACAFKGIILGGWRNSVCSNEVSACPGNQVFLYNITMCQQTCRSLADGEKYCLQDFAPVDGCGCPHNTYLDKQGNCVPISQCPCYYKGSYLEPGEYFTKDGERCVCRNAKVQCTSVKIRLESEKECSSNKTYFDCNAFSKWTSQTPLQLSCHTPQTDHFQTECISGCVCPEGLFDDGRGGCVEEKDCPCTHNNQWYSSGQKITVDCNTCTCQKGVWSCTDHVCYGTCMIYGSGHYITFDGKFYDFDGNCEYVAIQDFCGDKNSSGSFSIITENVPCGTTGVTCSKAIKMFLGKTELKLENKEYKEIQRDVGDDVVYWNRTVGLYLVIEASNGVMLIWDKKTTVFIKLSPDYKSKVCGLCGNFDDKSNNDFTTRSGLQETNALKFGNSWKQSPMCPDVTQEIKPCDMKPHRKSWAEKECSIIQSEVFKICHSKVNPVPFYEACVHDACSCDSGGDCECFCSAVAAYAQECTKAEACVFWRTPDICPIFCDYYNPRDECEWHYEPCGSNITTCRMINDVSTNVTVTYLEGCYPRCPKDKPIYNEETKECVTADQCWCYVNGTHVPPGHEIPTEENCTICICGPSGSIQCKPLPGCPCVINGTSYEVGQTVAQVQDGDICITYICAENGSVVPDKIYPCPTSSSPTITSTSFPTSTLTTTVATTSHSVITTPCIGLICNWTEWFDVSNPEKDGGDYETYDEIRKHGHKICEAPEKIECRAEDMPDVSLEQLGQKVECNLTYGLICKNEEQDVTMWQLCYNYEIRVNCCEWQEIPCETPTTPSTISTTTKTTVLPTTTSRNPTTTSEPTPSVSTPVTTTSSGTGSSTLSTTSTPTQSKPTPTTPEETSTSTASTTVPPRSTTTTSTPWTTTTPTPTPDICECVWTDWIDVSYPNSSDRNSGDYETFDNIKKSNSSWVCAKAENISCRAKKFPDVPIANLGQVVECNVDTGLICNNKDQQIGGIIPMPICLNYEISVCCVPNIPECITTTTASTTTSLPSSTTGRVSRTTPTTVTPETPSETTTTTVPPSNTTSSSTPRTTTPLPVSTTPTATTSSTSIPTPTYTTTLSTTGTGSSTPSTTSPPTQSTTTPTATPEEISTSTARTTTVPPSSTTSSSTPRTTTTTSGSPTPTPTTSSTSMPTPTYTTTLSTTGAASPMPIQEKNHFPGPAGCTIPDTDQEAIGLLGHLCALLAHVQPAVYQNSQLPLCLTALQSLCPQSVELQGVIVVKVQDSVLSLVKVHPVPFGPSIQSVQVPLQSPPTLQQIDPLCKLGVICKFAKSRLNPLIQIITKDVKEGWLQHWPLGDTTGDWPPTGCSPVHQHSLGLSIQTVPNPAESVPVQSVGCQLFQEYVMGGSVKGFAEVETDYIHSLPLSHWVGTGSSTLSTASPPTQSTSTPTATPEVTSTSTASTTVSPISTTTTSTPGTTTTGSGSPTPTPPYEGSSTPSTISPPTQSTSTPTTTPEETSTSTASTTVPPISTTSSSTAWTTTVAGSSTTISTTSGTGSSTLSTTSTSTQSKPTPTTPEETSTSTASTTVPPRSTTTTSTPWTTTTPTPTPDICECVWTDWIDVSYPNSSDRNSGDYETFDNIKKSNSSWVCAKAENISCRAKKFPDVPIANLGQVVECNVDTGLICNNKDQQIGGIIPMPICLNYEISVCCVPNIPECITTTTASTTTSLPSSTTGRVSRTTPTTVTPETPSETTTTTVPPSNTTSSSTPRTTTPLPVSTTPTATTSSTSIPTPTYTTTLSTTGTGSSTPSTTSPPTQSTTTPTATPEEISTSTARTTTVPPSSTTSSSTPRTTTTTSGSPTPTTSSTSMPTPTYTTTLSTTGTGSSTPSTTSPPTQSTTTPTATPEEISTSTASTTTVPPSSTTSSSTPRTTTTTSGSPTPTPTTSSTSMPTPTYTTTLSTTGTGSSTPSTTSPPTQSTTTPTATPEVTSTSTASTTVPPSSTTSSSTPWTTTTTSGSPTPTPTTSSTSLPTPTYTTTLSTTGSSTPSTASPPTPSTPTPTATPEEISTSTASTTTVPPSSTTSSSTPRTTTTTSGSPTPTPTTSSTSLPTPTYTTTKSTPGTGSSTPSTTSPPTQSTTTPTATPEETSTSTARTTTVPPSTTTTSGSTPWTTTTIAVSSTPTSPPVGITTRTPQAPTTLPIVGPSESEIPTKTSTPVTPSATPLPTSKTTETGSTGITGSTTVQQTTSPMSTSPETVTTSKVTKTTSTPKTTTSGPTPSTSTSTTPVTETSTRETITTRTPSPPTGSHTTPVSTTTSGPGSTSVAPPPISTTPLTATTSEVTETELTTKTTSSDHTLSTLTTPATSSAIVITTTSGPSSLETTPGSTASVPSVSTSTVPVTTSGTTPTETFTTTSGTTSSSFNISTATTTSTTFETVSPGSSSTSGPTATSTAVTTTGSSTYSTVTPGSSSTTGLTPTTPKKICSIFPNESYEQGESWWLCNCTKAICIEDNIVQVIPIICNPPPKPTCTNGLSPVPVIDEDGCCWHWECDCYCTGWGDPHYMTFDGLYYSYQGNCTYVLVEEINKTVDNFGVYIDNYHCEAHDVVSCPRTLIVRHETQEVRLTTAKPNTLQVEVTVNNQLVALPYKKFGVSIYESGINRVVEISELKMNVTYNGLSFSIRMPYSLFGNNTQGQCGTCNNNTADDCMLPNGKIAENCETMADHWQVVDPSKPQCSPGLIPTSSPSTTPTEPCKESSICKLLLGSVFKPCHEFVKPEKYYAACVFDSCVLPNLDLECSSLQIYAATCADQGVCIDWRSHTNGVCCKYLAISHECPPGKEYRACGPTKEVTCKSSQQNETSTKQVEGCFCPNGTMLYDSGVDVCVKTCGCVGVDMIPREFGEKFTIDCQDCICLEGEHGIVCEPHVCAEQNKITCDGEGFYEVTEVNPKDSCCPLVTCKCNTSFCTAKAPKCALGFEVHSYIPSGQCCPVYQCVPKGVCVHQNAEFLPNSSVFVDKCQSCFCTSEVNVSTQLNIISCKPVPCNTYCKPGFEIKPVKGECCGRCVQTKCIIHAANSAELILSPGEFKNDPTNNCTIYSCVDVHNQLISSTSEITCPAFNEESCKPGTISFLPNGCCKTCAPVDSRTPCSVRHRKDFIVYNGCRSVDRVDMTECEGTCGTFSLYSAEANSMDHSCSCCRETRTTEKHVQLKCPGGHAISHKYIYVENCSCQDTECNYPRSRELQKREENDKASSLNRIKRAISLTSK
ncbi:mucin-2 [Pithys albifrons albifrons]|uniref:mucin-2 n=1 Tax=Pithys albifrons albifrons TaxID=3385563 RepID=UPI003A5CE0BE